MLRFERAYRYIRWSCSILCAQTGLVLDMPTNACSLCKVGRAGDGICLRIMSDAVPVTCWYSSKIGLTAQFEVSKHRLRLNLKMSEAWIAAQYLVWQCRFLLSSRRRRLPWKALSLVRHTGSVMKVTLTFEARDERDKPLLSQCCTLNAALVRSFLLQPIGARRTSNAYRQMAMEDNFHTKACVKEEVEEEEETVSVPQGSHTAQKWTTLRLSLL